MRRSGAVRVVCGVVRLLFCWLLLFCHEKLAQRWAIFFFGLRDVACVIFGYPWEETEEGRLFSLSAVVTLYERVTGRV